MLMQGENERGRERECVYVCAYLSAYTRACVSACVHKRLIIVTFVFIDEVFGVCVYVIIRGTEDVIIFCFYNCMSYYFYCVA